MVSEQALEQVRGWFTGRIPDGWFTGIDVAIDREEILVTGTLAEPEAEGSEAERAAARRSRIEGFREDSRGRRMKIAAEAERRFGRKVSWAARCGAEEAPFTRIAVPVMTRLRMRERAVLDTLIDGGVARSRSEALAWCVTLVADNQDEWLADLREALSAVEKVRAKGPGTAR